MCFEAAGFVVVLGGVLLAADVAVVLGGAEAVAADGANVVLGGAATGAVVGAEVVLGGAATVTVAGAEVVLGGAEVVAAVKDGARVVQIIAKILVFVIFMI